MGCFVSDEGQRQLEVEYLHDFERNWGAVDCFDAPEVIADLVFSTCSRDMMGSRPEEFRDPENPIQEDVVVRVIFADDQSLLLTRRFTREERLRLKVLDQLGGVGPIRRKFPSMSAGVLSLTHDLNWKEFFAALEEDEERYVRGLLDFWGRSMTAMPGDGTLIGIGGKPHTDRVIETLGTVLAAEVGEELNIDVADTVGSLVIPAQEEAFTVMKGMVEAGEDEYSLLNRGIKGGLVEMRPRLLGITLMYVMNEKGGVGRILYVVNSYQEGNVPPTSSYSYDAIQGVLVKVPIAEIAQNYPNVGPELAGPIEYPSRETLMRAISGEGWFTRMVCVDPAGIMHRWSERMELIPSGR